MQVTEDGAASKAEQLAHTRPAVERWLARTGLVPLPAFLLLHLSRELRLAFVSDVSDVVRPAPSSFMLLTAWVLVWLPLGVHAALGVIVLLGKAQLPAASTNDVARLGRLVSRATAIIGLVFIAYHGRAYGVAAWLGESDPRDAGFRLVAELSSTRLGVPVFSGAYLIGLLATVTHAGLGVHRALLLEGVLHTAARRARSARLCAAFGVLLFSLGAAAVIRVATGVLLR